MGGLAYTQIGEGRTLFDGADVEAEIVGRVLHHDLDSGHIGKQSGRIGVGERRDVDTAVAQCGNAGAVVGQDANDEFVNQGMTGAVIVRIACQRP